MEKKIGIASDHAGYEMKEFLVGYLAAKGWDVLDFGPESEESVDYPDFAHPLANAIESGELERGIGLCGSGEGMAITLNKHQGIRAGLVWDKQIAHLIRQHNNANVIVLPARSSPPTRQWNSSKSSSPPISKAAVTSDASRRFPSRRAAVNKPVAERQRFIYCKGKTKGVRLRLRAFSSSSKSPKTADPEPDMAA